MVKVEQVDRDLAVTILVELSRKGISPEVNSQFLRDINDAEHDDDWLVQAAAKARIEAQAELVECLRTLAAHVEACRLAFPNDPVSSGQVCRESCSFRDFERVFDLLAKMGEGE